MTIPKKVSDIFSAVTSILLLAAPTTTLAGEVNKVRAFKGTVSSGLIDTIINIINSLLLIAAIFAVVFVIISGVRYFSSQGDEAATKQARGTLIYAIVGVIIILLSVIIINFFSPA